MRQTIYSTGLRYHKTWPHRLEATILKVNIREFEGDRFYSSLITLFIS